MAVKIQFPELIQVPLELPIYAIIPPAWTGDKVAAAARRFDLKGDCVDAGPWFITRDKTWTLEVYQASHSLRLERNDYDAEGRKATKATPDRDKAMAVAQRFMEAAGDTMAKPEFDCVTELRVATATRENREGEARVVGLQVNYRYALGGLALVGPGAKAQVSVGPDGQLAQAYRFAREVKQVGVQKTTPLREALDRFARGDHFADLPDGARAEVKSIQLGLLSLPPTEVQGVLIPSYVLRGEVSTELQPRYEFIAYVAAAEVDERDAKLRRFPQGRPSLLSA